MIVTETPRLELRHVTTADASDLETIFCDPAVMRFGGPVRTPAWVETLIAEMVARYYDQWGYGRWSVVAKTTGSVVGICGLTRFANRALEPGESELGYRFASSVWGLGYAAEAASAACSFGFDVCAIASIVAHIDPANAASIRVAEKVGMRFDRAVKLPGANDTEYRYVLSSPQAQR